MVLINRFKYLWNPGGKTTEDLKGVCSGDYLLEVENTIGCKMFKEISLEEPDSVVISSVKKDASCGVCNGSILVSPSGGRSPYEFEWLDSLKVALPGETDSLIENLCSGKYFVKVKDASGCSKLDSIIILKPEELFVEVDVDDRTCFGECNGEIRITISGGVEPYDIVWKDKEGLVIGTTDTLSKLCAGSFTAVIKDSNLCSKPIGPIIIESYDEIEATFKVDSALCTKK